MASDNSEQVFRALALDGGGTRGLYTATLLETLARRFDKQFSGDVHPDIGAAFDLICGTSTGSILACALASGVPMTKVRQIYTKSGAEIFPKPMPKAQDKGMLSDFGLSPLLRWTWAHRSVAAGNAKRLRELLLEVLGTETLGQVYERRGIALCVPTINAANHHPMVLKTGHIPDKHRDDNYQLADVCLASSAAPIFLPIHRMKDPNDEEAWQSFVDGGLWANNPILTALVEALQITKGARPIEIISVGTCSSPTGDPASVQSPEWGILDWKAGIGIVEMSMSAQAAGHSYAAGLLAQSLNDCGLSLRVFRLPEKNRSAEQCSAIGLDRSDDVAIQTLLDLAKADADSIHADTLKDKSPDHQLVRDIFSTLSVLVTEG